MDLNKYKVSFVFCCKNSLTGNNNGYEIVFAKDPENAKQVAKRRALEALKEQKVEIVFIDIKDAVLMH